MELQLAENDLETFVGKKKHLKKEEVKILHFFHTIIDADDDTQQNLDKALKEMGVANGSILSCDDFLQDYNVKIMIEHS
jgi:hypothetical protein